jgi:hypothetical protein
LAPRGDALTEFLSIELIFLITYPGTNTPAREKITLAFASATAAIGRDTILRTSDFYERARCEIEYYNRVFAEDCLNTINSVVRQETLVPEAVKRLKRDQAVLGGSLPITVFCISAAAYCFAVYALADNLGGT